MDELSGRYSGGAGGVLEEWHPLLIGSTPNPSMTFESFHAGRANAWLMDTLTALCSGMPSTATSIIFVHGSPGVGKTHLLSAAAQASNGRAQLIPVADLEAELSRAKRLGALAECYQWLFGFDLLLLDGVDHATGNEVFEADMIHILDRIVSAEKTALLTSSVLPHQLAVSNSRLTSLLSGGLMSELKICEEAERVLILRETFPEDTFSDEIVHYLAKNVTDSIRRLKAGAQQIAAIAGQTGMPATLEMARAVVPLPEDLQTAVTTPSRMALHPSSENSLFVSDKASLFREMLDDAETEEEQALALQIAIAQRLRELKESPVDDDSVPRMESALALLREGRLPEAMQALHPDE